MENSVNNQKRMFGLFRHVNEFMGPFLVIMWRGKKAYMAKNIPKKQGTLKINWYLLVHQKIIFFVNR